ncbi:MAG: FlgD immunoglobulin-like domain containing protein, partial [Melioribacter sp.]|nr:FlgD immunoglobulin-like domain containing protein [Melioribacter sp.]
VETTEAIPTQFNLFQNYPNPFNPSTIISYALPKQSMVTIKIYDILGREVKTLLNSEQAPGVYKIEWNGTNNIGNRVAAGTYIYRIEAGDFVQAKKMILLK